MISMEESSYRWEEASPDRTATRLSYCSCSGWYRSIRGDIRLPFESLLERDLMVIQDIDPDVVAFAGKPETLIWADGRRERRYTPDFRVVTREGKIVYREAMPRRALDADPSLKGRRPHITDACALRGAAFEIWTETEIRKQPRLANCARIRAAVAFLTPANLAIVQAGLAERRSISLGALQATIGLDPILVGTLLGLVAIGELALDLDAVIGPSTELHSKRTA
ncbi:hypothetical protein [Azospirillum argentinense]